jgi:thioredoxin 1
MATTVLTESNFADIVENNDIVLVDFWAEWCGPCRMFAPIFEKVSNDNPDVVFAKVDTEAEHGLAGAFNISSIPTLMAIREGVVLYAEAGAIPEESLKNLLTAIRDVDMDTVKAEIAKEQNS